MSSKRNPDMAPFLPLKHITCVPHLRNVNTGLFLRDINIMIAFELIYFALQIIITVTLTTYHHTVKFLYTFQMIR